MRCNAADVRIVDVESCDFGLMRSYDTATLLRAALPDTCERYLESAVSRRLIGELGVTHRYLSHLPGQRPDPSRLTAFDLARSAVQRLLRRRKAELEQLDALIFVSTSNPNPCNSQASLIAEEFGFTASCLDLKAGCSGGVLGLMQAALMIRAGCERVLVVMAENLSHLTPPTDLRMLLTVGDGAACVLLEKKEGPGFLTMIHGSNPTFARAITVKTPFPPPSPNAHYAYEVQEANVVRTFLEAKWRSLFVESLSAAGLTADALAHWYFHQTHGAQFNGLLADLGVPASRTVNIVESHGNMGTPTFAVAMARGFANLQSGQPYLLQAVGGGVSWCSLVAEHA